MKFKIVLFLSFLLNITHVISQEITLANKLTTDKAFTKLLFKNFSYLLLGEDSQQQGIAVVQNDDKNTLKVNGNLLRGDYSLLNIEGNFETTGGVYFFDEDSFNKKAKLAITYSKLFNSSIFYNPQSASKQIFNRLFVQEKVQQSYTKFLHLYQLLIRSEMLNDSDTDKEKIDKVLNEIKKNYKSLTIDTSSNIIDNGFYVDYKKKPKNTRKSLIFKKGDDSRKIDMTVFKNYDLLKVLSDYREIKKYILKELEDELVQEELKYTEDNINLIRLPYYSVGTFYERASFRKFSLDPAEALTDMIQDRTGDLFGGNLSLNLALKSGKGKRFFYKYLPLDRFFFKGEFSLYRSSNIAVFEKNAEIKIDTIIGQDQSGNDLIRIISESASLSNDNLVYGIGTAFDFDLYYYPCKEVPLGVFGEFQYRYDNYSSYAPISDDENSAIRYGILFNIKSKKKDKEAIVFRAFLDRSNLNIKPTGPDGGRRFGFAVGLPINFK